MKMGLTAKLLVLTTATEDFDTHIPELERLMCLQISLHLFPYVFKCIYFDLFQCHDPDFI